jgi:hypothetical protein
MGVCGNRVYIFSLEVTAFKMGISSCANYDSLAYITLTVKRNCVEVKCSRISVN